MSRVGAVLTATFAGVLVGVVIAFVAMVATGAVALLWSGSATIPGVFDATATRENGAAALSFIPHPTGLLVVVLVIGAVDAVRGTRRRQVPA